MPAFLCKIGTADGRVLEKEFEAPSRELLRENLQEQGFHVFRIRQNRFRLLFGQGLGIGRMSGRAFLSFNQELVVLLRSGLPILQVLDAISERMEAGRVREVLREIREDIRGGAVLSEAFAKYPVHFPQLYIASIRAGERSGELPITISRYITYLKRVEAIRAKVRSASFYPMLLSVAVAVVLLFLMLYVIPSFTQIYADASVSLPLATRVLIAVADGMWRGLPFFIPFAIIAGMASTWYLRSEPGQRALDRVKLVIPFFGKLFIDYALLGFCRTLGTTLASGIPVVQAMHMSRGTLNNRILEEKLTQAVRRIEEGSSISTALAECGFFPSLALRMIGVGETTGALAEMLGDVSDYYETEVEMRLDRLTTLVEPLMMMTMGLLIGGIVVAMYIPIFQLAGTVR